MQSIRFSRQFRLVGAAQVLGVGVAVPITTRSAVPAVASAHVAVLGCEFLTADSIRSSAAKACRWVRLQTCFPRVSPKNTKKQTKKKKKKKKKPQKKKKKKKKKK